MAGPASARARVVPAIHARTAGGWMAGTGPIGIGIRSGRRPDSLSSSSPDVIRGSPQPTESAWIPGSIPGSSPGTGMTRKRLVPAEKVLGVAVILMPGGACPGQPLPAVGAQMAGTSPAMTVRTRFTRFERSAPHDHALKRTTPHSIIAHQIKRRTAGYSDNRWTEGPIKA
jgi:hypothetical protein